MKMHALLVCLVATPALAQDTVFSVRRTTDADRYVVLAELLSAVPPEAGRLDVVWSDASFLITGDAPVTFDAWNPGYRTQTFGDPIFSGAGTTAASFTGLMLGTGGANIFGEALPDDSNPLLVTSFEYQGDPSALTMELFGQNSIIFEDNPAEPFGDIRFYLDALGNPGTYTFGVQVLTTLGTQPVPVEDIAFFVPTPGTAAVASLVALAAVARRR